MCVEQTEPVAWEAWSKSSGRPDRGQTLPSTTPTSLTAPTPCPRSSIQPASHFRVSDMRPEDKCGGVCDVPL